MSTADVLDQAPLPAPERGRARGVLEVAGSFQYLGYRLAYTEYGGYGSAAEYDDLIVLTHGIMLTRRMHAPLARALAAEGHRVITLDLLGHGESDRPDDSWQYSIPGFAAQVLALLEHLGAGAAVVGGTSLGANVALEVGVAAPERVHGLVVEMPVLDNALVAGLLAFGPLLFAARFLPLAVNAVGWLARQVPHGNQWVDVVTDALDQSPEAMAALLHGVFFGRIAPPKPVRGRIVVPTLVIGHEGDPIHPFGDADTLAADLPDAEFVRARSPVELRFDPDRLTTVISDFAARCFPH